MSNEATRNGGAASSDEACLTVAIGSDIVLPSSQDDGRKLSYRRSKPAALNELCTNNQVAHFM